MARTFNEFAQEQPNFDESFWGSLFGNKDYKSRYQGNSVYGRAWFQFYTQFLNQGMDKNVAAQSADEQVDEKRKSVAGDYEMKRLNGKFDPRTDSSRTVTPVNMNRNPFNPTTHDDNRANQEKAREFMPPPKSV